ncbi:hypothetical protein [Methylocystis sp.]|uniref:hypothetical protein n=1 Tax=Methylocystis sp. TaxID=1911079 RepID=UPI003DA68085
MSSDKELGSVLTERKEALLEELTFMHDAIALAKSRPEANADWIGKLENGTTNCMR